MNPVSTSISASLPMEQAEKIRLQRLIQQRKRMEYMSSLICEQKKSITTLKQQNQELTQSNCDLKLQIQLLHDKLNLSSKYNDDISQVLIKQSSLLQSFRQLLLSTDLHINQHQRQCLLGQIQSSYERYQRFNLPKIPSFNFRPKFEERLPYSMPNHAENLQIARLTEQNQELNEKFQQLCSNYVQLSKDIKLKQLQIINLTNNESFSKMDKNHNQESYGHIRTRKAHTGINNDGNINEVNYEEAFFKRIIKEKDSEIFQLSQEIRQLKIKHQKKEELIKWHRKNEKQQKKLLHFFQKKFNLEGNQLCHLVSHSKDKLKHHMNDSPYKIFISPQVDKGPYSSKKFPQKTPLAESLAHLKSHNYSTSNLLKDKSTIFFKKQKLKCQMTQKVQGLKELQQKITITFDSIPIQSSRKIDTFSSKLKEIKK